MPAPIYVLGHRNPDSDAVCAAVGYTCLLRMQGQEEAVACRQGPLRRETAFILERFSVDTPQMVTDVRPRVADVMTSPAVSVQQHESVYRVGQVLESENVRVVTVVDEQGRLVGVTGQADFAQAFITGLELAELDQVPLDLDNLVSTLGGRLLVNVPGRELRDRVMVGAMEISSMLNRIEPDILLVVGDRADVQRAAIEFGVGALVVTGDNPVDEATLGLARQNNVVVIAVPHHTYTTLRLIQLSIPVHHVMRRDVATCGPDELAEDVRERLRNGSTRSLIVVGADGRVEGIVSRSNLLRTVRKRVVLIDHNERSQAVAGVEEADVVAVVDHHRVADFWTRTPPYMRLEPVGATSTIVAKLFGEASITPPPQIAGVLLGGILNDTLLFRGPTTTDEDRRVVDLLARIAGVDVEEFGMEILDLASDVSDRSANDLLMSDFKEFRVGNHLFGIGTIETTNGASVLARREDILGAMKRLRERGYTSVLFAVVDIMRGRSTVLIDGHSDEVASGFDKQLADGRQIEFDRILSRKKHLVPVLGAVSSAIGDR